MTTRYQIQVMRNGLRIRVRSKSLWWEQVLAGVVAGVAVWWTSETFFNGRWRFISSVLTAVFSLVATTRAKRVELTATNVEFITHGNFSSRFRRGQTVCTGDIRWLEFQEASGAENPPSEQGGLYAVTTHGNVCLLPFLTEAETIQVISKIENVFPGLTDHWRAESAFNTHYLTLGLAKSK